MSINSKNREVSHQPYETEPLETSLDANSLHEMLQLLGLLALNHPFTDCMQATEDEQAIGESSDVEE